MAVSLDTFKNLPNSKKAIIIFIAIIIVLGGYYFTFYSPLAEQKEKLNIQLKDLEKKLSDSEKVAKEFPKFQEELIKIKNDLEIATSQLPASKEIPDLLKNITRLGNESGLEFLLFRPQQEVPLGFYAKIPIQIEVSGNYHEIAIFFDKISRLPRIVNIDELNMVQAKESDEKVKLKASFLATTFKFIETQKVEEKKTKEKK